MIFFQAFHGMMNQIVITFGETFLFRGTCRNGFVVNSFPLAPDATYSSGIVCQGKIKVCGTSKGFWRIFTSFCCSCNPDFAELLRYSIDELSLKVLPIHDVLDS